MVKARIPFLFCIIAAAAGCPDEASQNFRVTVGGTIVNEETRQPLNATANICNLDQVANTDGDGLFQLDFEPGLQGGQFTLAVQSTGFADRVIPFGFFPDTGFDDLQNRLFVDLGTIGMRRGTNVTLRVSIDGMPLDDISAFAAPDVLSTDGTAFDCHEVEIVEFTTGGGMAVFANLDPLTQYMVVVPSQDVNLDGIPDFFEASTFFTPAFDGNTVAIDLDPIAASQNPFIIGTNLVDLDTSFFIPTGSVEGEDTRVSSSRGIADLPGRLGTLNEAESVFQANTMADGSVRVVFNRPVAVVTDDGTGSPAEPSFLWLENLADDDEDPTDATGEPDDLTADPDVFEVGRIGGTVTSLAGGTILHVTPASPLKANEFYTLDLFVAPTRDLTNGSDESVSFYRPPGAMTSIPFGLDNFNGSQDGSGGVNEVQLRFPGVMDGHYEIFKIQSGTSVTTFETPSTFFFNSSDDAIIFNSNAAPATGSNVGESGVEVGSHYTIKLRHPTSGFIGLNDNTVATPNRVTMKIHAVDSRGEVIDGIFELDVE